MLDLHIPPGGGMEWEACVESFRRATAFFPAPSSRPAFYRAGAHHLVHGPAPGHLLPPTANPLRLQRAGYLYPTLPDPGGLWFVFLQPTHDPALLPRDTSLRRALAEFLDTGATWHGGGMFLLREDLAAPAEGQYRAMFDALIGNGV